MGKVCRKCGHRTEGYDWFISIETDKNIKQYLVENRQLAQLGGWVPMIYEPSPDRANRWCLSATLYCEKCDAPAIEAFVEKVRVDINPDDIFCEYA